MKSDQFADLLYKQMSTCEEVLVKTAREYSDDTDRLHNFKVAAALQGLTVKEALSGMMAKHTVSIYDMCGSVDSFTVSVWDEKITDHIIYLILLRAIVEEEAHDLSNHIYHTANAERNPDAQENHHV